MATLNINDPKYFDPFLKTLRDNTSLNYHTENSYLIVYNFGSETEKNIMKDIEDQHKKEGHLSKFVNLARYYLVKNVLNNIEDKKLSNKLSGCLWLKQKLS